MAVRPLSPVLVASLIAFMASFLLIGLIANHALTVQAGKHHTAVLQGHLRFTQTLAEHIGWSLRQSDDLHALSTLQRSKRAAPALQGALVFDSHGKILLHTDPEQLGKIVPVPQGPRLTTPDAEMINQDRLRLLAVTLPLPESETDFFRTFFDLSAPAQQTATLTTQSVLLAFGGAVIVALLVGLKLRGYTWIDPRAKSEATLVPAEDRCRQDLRALFNLLPLDGKTTVLCIDRKNLIVSFSPVAGKDLNLSQESLIGRHILQTSLPEALTHHYLTGEKTPETSHRKNIPLDGHDRLVILDFVPAAPHWRFACFRW